MSTSWINSSSSKDTSISNTPRIRDFPKSKESKLKVLYNTPTFDDISYLDDKPMSYSQNESSYFGLDDIYVRLLRIASNKPSLPKEDPDTIVKEGFQEGLDCPHIFKDIPGLGSIIYVIKHLYLFVQYVLEYVAIMICKIGGDGNTDDIKTVYTALYYALILITSFHFLHNWYYVTIFCSNIENVRSRLANGKTIDVTYDFFTKIFGESAQKPMVASFISILNFLFINAMSPVILLYQIIQLISYIADILPNKVIFVGMHVVILYIMIAHGTQIKELHMTLFNKDSKMEDNLLKTVILILIGSLLINSIPFAFDMLTKFGSANIITIAIVFVVVLVQWVITFLLAKTAVFFVVFILLMYSFFAIFAFANMMETIKLDIAMDLPNIRDNEGYSIIPEREIKYHHGGPSFPEFMEPISKIPEMNMVENKLPSLANEFPSLVNELKGDISNLQTDLRKELSEMKR
jgi:hypothetical protein